jgi:hypothetical protein
MMFAPPRPTALVPCLVAASLLSALTGCGAIKRTAINNVASTLAESGVSATSDNDPEVMEGAFPYQLKLQEGLLESVPHNHRLLLATCRLSTQYGYAFMQGKADMLGEAHHDEVVTLRERALNMYLRGKGYCLRALDERFKNVSVDLVKDQATMEKSVKRFTDKKKDVELLYWTAASWGAAISLAKDKPLIVIDHPVVRALAEQALALDESWNRGALHELMITLDSLPDYLGGSVERARKHFDRAIELQHKASPGPYVALAMGVDIQEPQNREEFIRMMKAALAIDPEADPNNRLVTILTQRRAKALLDQIDTLFGGKQPAGSFFLQWSH